jgi:cytochrome c oxidase subunit 1
VDGINPTGGPGPRGGAPVMVNAQQRAADRVGGRLPSAKELGIPMPNPSIWPLICATGVVVMFCGLMFLEKSTKLGVSVMVLGTLWWVASLMNWLTTPLEDAH